MLSNAAITSFTSEGSSSNSVVVLSSVDALSASPPSLDLNANIPAVRDAIILYFPEIVFFFRLGDLESSAFENI